MSNYTSMEFPQFLKEFTEAAILAGIATENPSQDNLNRARQSVDELKRRGDCYIEGEDNYKRQMPNMWLLHNQDKVEHAETLRQALREVGICVLKRSLQERTIIR
ncbi:MAG: hypothetical protein Q8O16_02295 [Dehalococcoidia bacterium]|nr:hypothetical protein [Dehalococcoidia bacterium]